MSSQVAIQIPKFLHQINQLVISDNNDPLILTQLKNEVQNNNSTSDIDGYLALGTIAGLEGNIDALQTNYQRAITESSDKHAYILMLYAKCLTQFGFFSQAADLLCQAYLMSPQINYLDDAIYFYGFILRLNIQFI